MTELSWTREPYYRRTPEEHEMKVKLIEEFMTIHKDCRYDVEGVVEVTAQPKAIDRHNFTPTERITLDYEGRF